MPLVTHPRVRRTLVRLAAVTCAAALTGGAAAGTDAGTALAAPAAAPAAPCAAQALTTPFAAVGDTSSYFLIPGGAFQSVADAQGWSLSNAALTPGGPTTGTPGSLTIAAGGSATSPVVCMDRLMPSLRFMAQEVAAGSPLTLEAVIALGRREITLPLAWLADGTGAQLAPVSPVALPASLLPRWLSLHVALRFSVPDTSGSWRITDVYVDPYRTS